MTLQTRLRVLTLVMLVLWLTGAQPTPAAAQSIIRWSTPQRIPGYFDKTTPPYMVVDQNRTVHAMTSQKYPDGEVVIFYNRWTLEGGWTKPVDVLISPVYEARLMGVVLDKAGILHVLFFGGNDNGALMYYASARLVRPGADWRQCDHTQHCSNGRR
jgi:hypothetical protein